MIKSDELIDKVLEQIKEDVNYGNLMAIEELMKHIPEELLEGFLGQDQMIDPERMKQWKANILPVPSAELLKGKGSAPLNCYACGNPHFLREEDAGSDREIARLCTRCFERK